MRGFLSAMLLLATWLAIPLDARAQTNTVFRCRLETAALAVGGQTSLVIEMMDVQGLQGYELTLRYDPGLVQILDADAGADGHVHSHRTAQRHPHLDGYVHGHADRHAHGGDHHHTHAYGHSVVHPGAGVTVTHQYAGAACRYTHAAGAHSHVDPGSHHRSPVRGGRARERTRAGSPGRNGQSYGPERG